MTNKINVVTGDGQVAITATQIAAGPSSQGGRVNVLFANVGTTTETLVVTTTRIAGTARRVHRCFLDPNECLHIRGLPLNGEDSLLAMTTTALTVDYVVSIAAPDAPLEIMVFDDQGLPKVSPQMLEQLAAVFS